MFRMPAIIKLFLYLAAALAFALTSVPQAFAGDTAPTYIARVSGGSFNPSSICAGMSATAQVTGSLDVQNPNQEYEEGGDSWTYSPSVTGYKATQDAPYGAVPSNAVSVSGNVTASADKSTALGYYQITVSATDNFNVTHNGTTTPQSASGSTTLEICVVGLGAIQYNDPDQGWIALPSPLTALTGTSVDLKALPVPADASFPPGQPTWGGIASGSGATATADFSGVSQTVGDKSITVTLGAGDQKVVSSSSATSFDLKPYMVANDDFAGRSETQFGVGEIAQIFANPVPAVSAGLKWSASGVANLFDDGNGTGDGQFFAGVQSGGTSFTVTIQQGPSKGKTKQISATSVTPSAITEVKDPGREEYHTVGSYRGANGGTVLGNASAGFAGIIHVTPTNVSFTAIQVRETDVTATTATGDLASATSLYHSGGTDGMGGGGPNPNVRWNSVSSGDAKLGCIVGAGDDQVIVDAPPSIFPPPYHGGDADYEIPFNYRVRNLDGTYTPSTTLPGTVSQTEHIGNDGAATISKGGTTSSKNLTDPAEDLSLLP